MNVILEIGNFRFNYCRDDEKGNATEAIQLFEAMMTRIPLELIEKLASTPVDLKKAVQELSDKLPPEKSTTQRLIEDPVDPNDAAWYSDDQIPPKQDTPVADDSDDSAMTGQ